MRLWESERCYAQLCNTRLDFIHPETLLCSLPTTLRWVFSSKLWCVCSYFATKCLFQEQTVWPFRVGLYFWISSHRELWVMHTWSRCWGSNRVGHMNMFAVTSLCQMINSGEMKKYCATTKEWLRFWQYAGRMWRFGMNEHHELFVKTVVEL